MMQRISALGQRKKTRRHGAAAVEMAVILPVVLTLLLGAIDFSMIMYAYTTVSEAARAGARFAMTHGSMASIPSGPTANDAYVQQTVLQYTPALATAQLSVASTWPYGNNTVNSPVTVTVKYTYYPAIGKLVGLGTITVEGTTTMLITH